MFCPKCGKELREYERSCPYCGAAAAHGRGNRHRIKPMELIAIAAGVLALLLACTVLVYQIAQRKKEARWKELTVDRREAAAVVPVEPLTRQQFLRFTAADAQTAAAVPDYSVSGDLHEITNLEWMEWNGLSDTAKAILVQNLFVVEPDFYSEFFGRYEWNRYLQIPNFVTVDSMMHTYHLYFSLLLNRTEKQQLAAQLQTLSKDMLRGRTDRNSVGECGKAQHSVFRGGCCAPGSEDSGTGAGEGCCCAGVVCHLCSRGYCPVCCNGRSSGLFPVQAARLL